MLFSFGIIIVGHYAVASIKKSEKVTRGAQGNDAMMTKPIGAPPWQPTDLPTLRAAYSDRTAALMAYFASFAYSSVIEVKGPVSVPKELTDLGFNRLTSFHNNLSDGWAYVMESELLIVLAFRGTRSVSNWETNLHTWLIHPGHTDAHLRVHQGFYNAFEKLSDGAKGIRQKITEIENATAGRIPIYITGHSLGGALAQIAAAVLGSDQIAACYTFGSPRVGNYVFDLWVKPPSYRIINYADIVPQVPFSVPFVLNYRHSGDPRYMPDETSNSPYRFEPNVFQRVAQFCKGTIQLIRAGSILGIEDHQIGEYARKLDQIANARSQSR
jgi:triacylglycerol lipase